MVKTDNWLLNSLVQDHREFSDPLVYVIKFSRFPSRDGIVYKRVIALFHNGGLLLLAKLCSSVNVLAVVRCWGVFGQTRARNTIEHTERLFPHGEISLDKE